MKLAHICPSHLLETLIDEEETYHLVLVEQVLAEDPTYRTFYARRAYRGDTIILDNGAHEHKVSTSLDNIEHAADLLGPCTIVLPDDMDGDTDRNLDLCMAGLNRFAGRKVPLMAVPHGKDLGDFLSCVNSMSLIPEVSALGITKDIDDYIDYGLPRWQLIRHFGQQVPQAIHLLGVKNLYDLTDPYLQWRCTGVDTSRLVVSGLRNLYIDAASPLGDLDGRGPAYFTRKDYSLGQIHTARRNIAFWRRYLAS